MYIQVFLFEMLLKQKNSEYSINNIILRKFFFFSHYNIVNPL